MTPELAPAEDSPFHAGERQLQTLAGVREPVEQRGRTMIRDHMPDQHRELFGKLPFMVVGGLGTDRQPWATALAGPPGFMSTPDAQHLRLQPAWEGALHAHDPLKNHLLNGSPIGLLGIELHTRRRNRMNGTVVSGRDDVIEVQVRQSFGNCPKYIHPRRAVWAPRAVGDTTRFPPQDAMPDPGAEVAAITEGPVLSARAAAMVKAADTLFIASATPDAGGAAQARGDGVDVSHRAGPAGFIRVVHKSTHTELTIPDYVGNFLFNTLGNILLEPRVGLLFIDFEGNGDVLWLKGQASVQLDSPAQPDFEGAQRLLQVEITGGAWRPQPLPLAWHSASG